MSSNPFRYAIALTGSIASGKSTVASLLKLHGLQCIDADAVAHEILDQHPQEIEALFKWSCLHEGRVDRKKLGKLIFSDEKAREILNGFMHPRIRERIAQKAQRFEKLAFPYLIDLPLFFETNAYPIAYSAVVYTPQEVQISRLEKRSGLTREEALQRIHAQMDIELKKVKADFVIDNSGNLAHLQDECEAFVERVKKLNIGKEA